MAYEELFTDLLKAERGEIWGQTGRSPDFAA
jgi:hypothetical protein